MSQANSFQNMKETDSSRKDKRKAVLIDNLESRRFAPVRPVNSLTQDFDSNGNLVSSNGLSDASMGGLDAMDIDNDDVLQPFKPATPAEFISSLSKKEQPHQRQTPFNFLLEHEDLLYEVCRWLPAMDLINFYSVSKQFHMVINQRLTTFIVGNAQNLMPESAEVYNFKMYKSLNILDAAQNPSNERYGVFRDTPSLRWLKFIEFREKSVASIIRELAIKGMRLPRGASKVIKKVWLLMDIPDCGRRIGIIHNSALWSNSDLYIACMFFMKVDMTCSDPVLNGGERRMRRMLLAQRTLSFLDSALKREHLRNQYEMLQMFIRWQLNLPALLQEIGNPAQVPDTLFGVPMSEIASLQRENWTQGRPPLLRPDELVMRESVRRRLRFHDKIIDMFLWGNLHPVTGEDVFPTDWKGEVQTTFEDEVEDQVEKDIAMHASKEGTQVPWAKDGD